MEVTIYVKGSCITCKKVVAAVAAAGVPHQVTEFVSRPALDVDTLRELLTRAGLSPAAVIRKRDKHYKLLGLDRELPDDETLLRLMVEHPGLVQRPIVVTADRVWFKPRVDDIQAALQPRSDSSA